MKVNKKLLNKLRAAVVISALVAGILSSVLTPQSAQAKETTKSVAGSLYRFDDEDSKYEISDFQAYKVINNSTNYGTFTLSGNIKEKSQVNGFSAYEVSSGNVTFNYAVSNAFDTSDAESWHFMDDSSKTVDGQKLEEKILSGAVILQSSLDGESWITDSCFYDIADTESEFVEAFYTSKDIQQVNGCYYRVIIVYEVEKQIEDKKIAFVNVNNYERRKYAEVFDFYLINDVENLGNTSTAATTPRQVLGNKTKKDSGYTGTESITQKDPHYGWDLGVFTVNGFTREEEDSATGEYTFLKNAGDQVTLWFTLKQDINCLDNKSNLVINEDKDGWDEKFEVDKTNFKHGTLIIRYTDYEGNVHKPIVYTDYLAANVRTGADTKVELFEEGDYEVALDYEIKDKDGIDSKTNYQIAFNFRIRNGNTMIFPFDVTTGNELANNGITPNGFMLDMAKSRYLTIDVQRTEISLEGDVYTEDVRFNRPAKDGESYTDVGKYTFTVKNLYTNESTTKTIYVGTSPILKALAATGKTVSEINDILMQGAQIGEDGSIVFPSTGETVEVINTEESNEIKEEVIEPIVQEEYEENEESASQEQEVDEVEQNSNNNSSSYVFYAIIIVLIILVSILLIYKRARISNIQIEEPDNKELTENMMDQLNVSDEKQEDEEGK